MIYLNDSIKKKIINFNYFLKIRHEVKLAHLNYIILTNTYRVYNI